MRIKDDGKYEWRKEQYAEAAEQLGENTKSKGIDAATSFTIEMLSNLERAVEHEDMTPELAEILSTDQVRLLYEVTADIEIGDE
ncbi:DUF7692 domain-containing protein [Halalkalicoccus salilacus]|uniref:DUF7692 domain-containing protein n=1 Tax=Halalkalicoccus TaxID=332246 RepID=UPI002F96802F